MLTLEDFQQAAKRVADVTVPTRLLMSESLSAQTGNTIYLKPENLQHTGSYKVRGAYNKISMLTDEERSHGIIAASAGNHAQGVAYAATSFNTSSTIVMPKTTPLVKIKRTERYGAQVVLHGEVFDEAYSHAVELAERDNLTFIHPFNDETIAAGQGTIALEILKELPDVDVILVPVGGGGLATGVSTAAKLINPRVQVIGVEPAGAACLRASLDAGHIVTLDSVSTIADGTAVKEIGDVNFPYLQENLDDVIVIPDEELIACFLDIVENHKIVVENSGLLSVAAAKHLQAEGKKVVCVLSGGSMDVITMASVVQHGLIQRDRVFTVSILLPDRPFELVRVATAIAESNGNVIRLDHNQFVSINRLAQVELVVTIESSGTEHKERILNALRKEGYDPRPVQTHL